MIEVKEQARRFDQVVAETLRGIPEDSPLGRALRVVATGPYGWTWGTQRMRAALIRVAPTRYNDFLQGRRARPNPVAEWIQTWKDRVASLEDGPVGPVARASWILGLELEEEK